MFVIGLIYLFAFKVNLISIKKFLRKKKHDFDSNFYIVHCIVIQIDHPMTYLFLPIKNTSPKIITSPKSYKASF